MRENRRSGTKFYCFSPPVMLATFCVEIGLLIYVIARYKMTLVTRIVAAMLICLALFQLAEYNVCGQANANIDGWSRAGFAAITLLPALGVHLLRIVTGRGWSGLTWLAYGSATIWIAIFALAGQAFNPHVCGGNYVIFHLSGILGGVYYVYYYFLLVITLLLAAYFAKTATRHVRTLLQLLIIGYSVFIVPTIVVNTLKPETRAGLTSIMCGFAVIYAFILVCAILPRLKVPLRSKYCSIS